MQKSHFLDRGGLRGFPWVLASVLYTISYGWFWNVRDSYWSDDWWAFYEPGIPKLWAQLGLAPWIVFNKWLFALTGPGFLRLIIFVCFFLSAICFYGISKKLPYLNERYRKFATLLFLLLPFNSARVSLMTFHYSISYFLFFFAWYLIIYFKSIRIRLLATLLFFLSFQLHSLPVFFALPILHLYSFEIIKSWRNLIVWVRDNFFLIIVSPVYWILRWFFWNTTETGYHNPSIPQLWLLTKTLSLPSFIFVAVLAFSRLRASDKRDHFYLVAISLFMIFLGLAPYIVFGAFDGPVAIARGIGLLAGYWTYFIGRSSWWTRMLMLQPLGITMFLSGLISFLPLRLTKMQGCLQGFLVSFCVVFNVSFGFEYMVDYAKQKAMISELKDVGYNSEISDYVFIDKSAYLNARGRDFLGEWQYLIYSAYGFNGNKSFNVSTQCRASSQLRLVVIDGEASYLKAFQAWLSKRNFGFSVEILDGPTSCTPDLIENRGRQNPIPLLFYFRDLD